MHFNVWYRHPALGLDIGCKPFMNDADVLVFLNDVRGHDVINIYIEHVLEEEPEIIKEPYLLEFTPVDVDKGKGSEVVNEPHGTADEAHDSDVEALNTVQGTVEGVKEKELSIGALNEGQGNGEGVKKTGEGVNVVVQLREL